MSESFMLGEHRVEPTGNGYWLFPRSGARGRFIPYGSETARRIEAGHALTDIDRTRRAFAAGTHEPVVAWREADGTLSIPPDPSFAPPPDAERFEIRTLAEADRVAAEERQRILSKWQGDEEFTRTMDATFDNPRSQLITQMLNPKSEMERDVIRLVIKELDEMESQRQNVEAHAFFHWREHDAGH